MVVRRDDSILLGLSWPEYRICILYNAWDELSAELELVLGIA